MIAANDRQYSSVSQLTIRVLKGGITPKGDYSFTIIKFSK